MKLLIYFEDAEDSTDEVVEVEEIFNESNEEVLTLDDLEEVNLSEAIEEEAPQKDNIEEEKRDFTPEIVEDLNPKESNLVNQEII